VQRHQLSTTCKEHAVDIVEQLATYFAQLSVDRHAILVPRMLDMAAQFRAASAEQLARHVFGIGDAVSSEDFLRSVLEPGSVVATYDPARFDECLTNFGPALVGHFCVEEALKKRGVKLHTGQPAGGFLNKLGKQRR
jgi:hypothetical protein